MKHSKSVQGRGAKNGEEGTRRPSGAAPAAAAAAATEPPSPRTRSDGDWDGMHVPEFSSDLERPVGYGSGFSGTIPAGGGRGSWLGATTGTGRRSPGAGAVSAPLAPEAEEGRLEDLPVSRGASEEDARGAEGEVPADPPFATDAAAAAAARSGEHSGSGDSRRDEERGNQKKGTAAASAGAAASDARARWKDKRRAAGGPRRPAGPSASKGSSAVEEDCREAESLLETKGRWIGRRGKARATAAAKPDVLSPDDSAEEGFHRTSREDNKADKSGENGDREGFRNGRPVLEMSTGGEAPLPPVSSVESAGRRTAAATTTAGSAQPHGGEMEPRPPTAAGPSASGRQGTRRPDATTLESSSVSARPGAFAVGVSESAAETSAAAVGSEVHDLSSSTTLEPEPESVVVAIPTARLVDEDDGSRDREAINRLVHENRLLRTRVDRQQARSIPGEAVVAEPLDENGDESIRRLTSENRALRARLAEQDSRGDDGEELSGRRNALQKLKGCATDWRIVSVLLVVVATVVAIGALAATGTIDGGGGAVQQEGPSSAQSTTSEPTLEPTIHLSSPAPTTLTAAPTPTAGSTPKPTQSPSLLPRPESSFLPSAFQPTPQPTVLPTPRPTVHPTPRPTDQPTPRPTTQPTLRPSTQQPTESAMKGLLRRICARLRSTCADLLAEGTPQWEALEWLAGHPKFMEFEEWRQTQLYALATVAFSLEGWGLNGIVDWRDGGEDECSWVWGNSAWGPAFDDDRILCDSTGRVTQIGFHNDLVGKKGVPRDVALLSDSLGELWFGGVHFAGTIPTELSMLSRLKNLDLRYNGLTGRVPSELGRLSELEWLQLEGNDLTGTMPEEVCQMRSPAGQLEDLGADCFDEVQCDCCTSSIIC